MVRRSLARAAGICLALLLPFGTRAAVLSEPDGPLPSQADYPNFTDGGEAFATARDLSSDWVVAPTGTSGGSRPLDAPTWSPKAIVGFSTWDLSSSPSELLQQTDSPVPLPPAFWSFGSGALLLVLWSPRRAAGTGLPNEGHAS